MIPRALIAALLIVESGGNDATVGDNGQAHGALQIHPAVITDVNRVYGTHYTFPESAHVRADAIRICQLYLLHYCGPNGKPEEYARTWNGGPNGPRNPHTKKYWKKVKRALDAGEIVCETRENMQN